MDENCMIKIEDDDSFPIEVDPLALPTTGVGQNDIPNICSTEEQYAMVKFIHVSDLSRVINYVEKKIAAWKQQDKNMPAPNEELLTYRRKYDKRIKGLYVLIKDIVKVATMETMVSKSLGQTKSNIDARFPEQIDEQVPQSKDTYLKSLELKLENRNLKEKLKDAVKKQLQLENSLNIANKQVLAKQKENKKLRHLFRFTREDRDEILNNLGIFKSKLAMEEKKSSDLKAKCSSLAKELDTFKKERKDLDVVDTWFNCALKNQQLVKEQLAKLNEDVQKMCTPKLNPDTRTASDVEVTTEKKKKHFYSSERDRWLEEQDTISRDIEWEFCVLRDNLSLLKYDLEQKIEPVDFPEIETVIVSDDDGGFCLKEEVKEEGCSNEEIL